MTKHLLLLLLLTLGSSLSSQLRAKDVAAGPEDILSGRLRLPEPSALALNSRSALLPARFEREGGDWVFRTEVPLERDGTLELVALGPRALDWELSLGGPGLAAVPLRRLVDQGRALRTVGDLFDVAPGMLGQRYDVADTPAGTWRIEARMSATPRSKRAERSERPQGFLLVSGEGTTRVATELSTLALLRGEPVALRARAYDAESGSPTIHAAEALVEAGERRFRLTLADDGASNDGAAGDGVFGAWLPSTLEGDAIASVRIDGQGVGGGRFLRTTRHALVFERPDVLLTDVARTRVLDDERLEIELGTAELAGARKLQVSAEVWGRDAQGNARPACWLSKMVAAGEPARLVLDARWLNRAGLGAPLELREVRLQDPDSHVPLDRRAVLALPVDELPAVHGEAPEPVSATMRMGISGTPGGTYVYGGDRREEAGGSALMLVHGYCSGGGIWPAADFSEPKKDFDDPNANRSHDAFALELASQASGFSSFGVVAHSQGGAAALHLYTFYESGLDHASGGRRIQAVATPFLGTPLATIDVGIGCGTNTDLSTAGAPVWLAGIPSWARAEVHYYTTQDDSGFLPCQFATALFLDNPNDGVVERTRGQLSGGNDEGHVSGWCHSTGMDNPPNYRDASRNAFMDAAASR